VNYLDHIDALNLSAEQQALIKDIPDPMFRQTVRDFCVNQQFRRDYWVKGARKLNAIEQMEAIRAERVLLVQPRAGVSLKVTGNLGEATMQEAIYGPILDCLADHQPRSLGEIEQAVVGKANIAQVLQAALVLTGTGSLLAVQDEAITARAKPHCDRLNAHLMDKARGSSEINHLASPVTGGGITVDRLQQLFLLARARGKQQPGEWTAFVWQILAAQNQRLLKEGKALETPEENIAELTTRAQEFAEKRLPILKAMQIA
ncbi:MAG: methyltransferase regulatory domain-containing protein, partial [Thermoflexales bacterium]